MSDMVPAQFKFDSPRLRCQRHGCQWDHYIEDEALTEVVAVAREHVEEEHRGQ